jgi:hypothetical protein
MRSRIFFLAIVCFWLAMNYLLWRSQWGSHSQIGNAVPPAVVWEKILSAPDTSSLDIYDHDKKVGICHWIPSTGNSRLTSDRVIADDYSPDDMEDQVTGYSLTFTGNATLANSNRIGFEASLELSTNRTWKNFHVRVSLHPTIWDVRAVAATQKIVVGVEDHGVRWQKTLKFSDLHNPEKLMDDLGGSATLGVLAGMGLAPSMESLTNMAGNLDLQAHEDWMTFGHSKAHVYRLETVILGRHLYLFTSRVGEILWVEFPDKITLRNEAFEHF